MGWGVLSQHSRCPQPRVPPEHPRKPASRAKVQDPGHLGRGGRGVRLTRPGGHSWGPQHVSSWGPQLGDAAPRDSGARRPPRGASAVPCRGPGQAPPPAARPVGKRGAAAFHFLDRCARGSQEEAGPGGQGLFVRSHSAAAACSREPPGDRGSRAAPLGPGLAAGGAGVRGLRWLWPWPAGSLRGKLTGKFPSWHRAARRSGRAGDEAQDLTGSLSIPAHPQLPRQGTSSTSLTGGHAVSL